VNEQANENDSRVKEFATFSSNDLSAFLTDITMQTFKVRQWYGERLAWIENIHDEGYRAAAKEMLLSKRDIVLETLASKADEAAATSEENQN